MVLHNTVEICISWRANWQGKGNMTKKMGLCLQRGIRLPISPARVKDSSPVEKQRQACLHKLNYAAIQKRKTGQKNYAQNCAKGLDICGGMSGASISVISRLLFSIKKWINYHNNEHMNASENWETMNRWKNECKKRRKKMKREGCKAKNVMKEMQRQLERKASAHLKVRL